MQYYEVRRSDRTYLLPHGVRYTSYGYMVPPDYLLLVIHSLRESAISTITLPFSRCVILFAICKYTTYQAHSFTRPALPRFS